MFARVRRALAAAALGLVAAPVGSTPVASPTAANDVLVRFDPPIGAPLRYRSERAVNIIRDRQSTLRDRIISDDELMFLERNKDGFLLRWITTGARVEAQREVRPIMEQVVGAMVDKPMLIQTDSRGAPVAVQNLEAMRKLLVTSFATVSNAIDTRFAGLAPDQRAAAKQFFDSYLATFANVSDDALNRLLLEQPSLMFGAGHAAARPGRPVAFETRAMLPMTGTEVDMIGRVELRSHEPGRATTFVMSSSSSPEDVRRAVGAFTEMLFADAPEAQRARIAEGVRRLQDLSLTDELMLTVDGGGVPQRVSYRRRAGTPTDAEHETLIYERLP